MPSEFVVRVRTGYCFEGCVPQDITVHSDGRVEIAVPSRGRRRAAPSEIEALWRRLVAARAFDLPEVWLGSNCVTDQPWTRIDIGSADHARSVRFDSGCGDPTTAELDDIASQILQYSSEDDPSASTTETDTRREIGVHRLDDYGFSVSRSFFAEAFRDVIHEVRLVRDEESGEIAVYGVRRRSDWGALGFQNGDRIQSIAGIATSTDELLSRSLEEAQRRDDFDVSVRRGRESITLHYVLRE